MTHTTYDLDKNWKFKNANEDIWHDAVVPGTVHTDLYKQEIIPHPFEGRNETDLQWIDKNDWIYHSKIEIDTEMCLEEKIDLIFDGLDTYASVYVNDKLVLTADNMFRQWIVDIKPYTSPGSNELKVYFHSPIKVGLDKFKESPFLLPAPNDDSELGGLGNKQVSVYTRKAPYHYGWDWGPRFVTSGIWKTPKLNCWSKFKINDVFIEQLSVDSSAAELEIHVTIDSLTNQHANINVKSTDLNLDKQVELIKGIETYSFKTVIENPKLWWTHDLGKPNLYNFEVKVNSDRHKEAKTVTTGLRKLELVQNKDEYGKTFYFKLNGTPIFVKGTNHIPLDTFLPEISDARYLEEIKNVLDANMNMVRIWGGGIYERELMYNLCDRHGILIWQDFMFACSMYPGDEEFFENVRKEIEYNIRRLRNHPSISLWCGNNEIDSMWKEYAPNQGRGWKESYSSEDRAEIWNNYDKLFHQLIPKTLNSMLPANNYWPSSPMAELTNDGRQHSSFKQHRGDIHYWNVWHSHAPIEDYNNYVGRFMSEYGFQSFPENSTYKKIAPNEELSIDSESVSHHQKNKSGNDLILHYLESYYNKPKSFEGYLYLSQLLQGYAFDTAIRSHRRAMPYCMGTLYWQINDSWPGASWSTVDYYGNWKASHYHVKEAYKETILSFNETANEIELHIVTDSLNDEEIKLEVTTFSFSSNEKLDYKSINLHISKRSSENVLTIDKKDLLNSTNLSDIYLHGQISGYNDKTIDSNIYVFSKLKDIDLPRPSIEYSTKKTDKGVLYTFSSNAYAKGVELTSTLEGKFEDNYFDLAPNLKHDVLFVPSQPENSEDLCDTERLQIFSMVDYIE